MRSVSDQFTNYAQGDMIPIKWAVFMSFDKTFDDDISFFEIGTSLIGGGDFIKGEGDVVQEWDKYVYQDYSDRVLNFEVTKEVLPFASLVLSIATITFSNHDDFFSTGSGSSIDGNILPFRPIRIYGGYGNEPTDEVIPIFTGLTYKMPEIDDIGKTVKFTCIDFLFSLLDRPLQESALYVDYSTDEILTALFALAGITSVQLDFDQGLVTIPYAYFKKDMKLGDAIKKVLAVEYGRMYMNEYGVIQFKNRQNYDNSDVYRFNCYDNVTNIQSLRDESIINVVEINSTNYELQPNQKYYESISPITIPASGSATVWIEFETPITAADDPVYVTNATTSSFTVNTASDGSGSANSTDVTLDTSDVFADRMKLVFDNANASDLYITSLIIYATPVIATEDIYVRETDDNSISKYDERVLKIDTDFYSDMTEAESRALVIINDWSEYGAVKEIAVKGNFALQIDDQIELNDFDRIDNYKIIKITDKVLENANYEQILTIRKFTPVDYFTIGVSLIGGTDQISP